MSTDAASSCLGVLSRVTVLLSWDPDCPDATLTRAEAGVLPFRLMAPASISAKGVVLLEEAGGPLP